MKRLYSFLFAVALVAIGSVTFAGVAAAEDTVAVYADDAIYSYDCPLARPPYYYAVDTTGFVDITCAGAPTVYQYGFSPPRKTGAILMRIKRTDTGITSSRWQCGLLMVDGEDNGDHYVALDCRTSALPSVGGTRGKPTK